MCNVFLSLKKKIPKNIIKIIVSVICIFCVIQNIFCILKNMYAKVRKETDFLSIVSFPKWWHATMAGAG